jgi:hypothetical protein
VPKTFFLDDILLVKRAFSKANVPNPIYVVRDGRLDGSISSGGQKKQRAPEAELGGLRGTAEARLAPDL